MGLSEKTVAEFRSIHPHHVAVNMTFAHSCTRKVLFAAVLVLACAQGEKRESMAGNSAYGGTLVIATATEADALLPPIIMSTIGKQVADMLFDPLVMVNDDLHTVGDKGYSPRLADRWEWSKDSLSLAFHLDPRARWQDGRRVVAADVKFTFDLIRNPATASFIATSLTNIDSVTVRDSSTAVVWYHTRSPEQFFVTVYNLVPIPQHVYGNIKPEELKRSTAAHAPIGSGRFRLVSWVPNATLEVIADTTSFRGRPTLDRIIWSTRLDPNAAMASVLSGETDFFDVLRGDAIKQIATAKDAVPVRRPSSTVTYLAFRTRLDAKEQRPHSILGDRNVRRALTMAIDRPSLTRNLVDTLGLVAVSPYPRSMAVTDTTLKQIPFDVEGARKLLEAAGWRDSNGDGVREKDGKPLVITITTPSSSTARMRAAVLLQDMMKQIGVKLNVATIEGNAMQATVRAGNFEMALLTTEADPSPSGLTQNWGSHAALTGEGFNVSMYINPAFDATIDSARREFDASTAKKLYNRAAQMLLEDAPAVWLYETLGVGAMNKRIRPAAMRADFWWAHLDEWGIEPSMAIARDRIGLREDKP